MWKQRQGTGAAPLLSGLALLLGTGLAAAAAAASDGGTKKPGSGPTQACRIEGMPNEMQCGSLMRPLDPAKPQGTQIEIHYLVVPAMARNKQPDPVLMLAGGPGQSAISLAPRMLGVLKRLNNRRDLVFIDQRGTGKSAPLQCADDSKLPVAEALDPQAQERRLRDCQEALSRLPHGDLRQYTTTIAMQDFEAVRLQLGAPQWNLYGASYGTRAALEYMRQYPGQVRRALIDGVAPPDMVLPASFSTDNQVALDAAFAACEKEAACQARHPQLRAQWQALLASVPRQISVRQPLTGKQEQFTLTRSHLLRAVRGPLYMPALASALPPAIGEAAEGRFDGLMGLTSTMTSAKSSRLAMGMHFSVVCAEDLPRLPQATDKPGADYGNSDALLYSSACKSWPRGEVPEAFYQVPKAAMPVLVLSGGADPVTPPRHGERVAKALGDKAQHIVVPEAGHGVATIGCMRDVMFRFFDAKTDAAALPQDAACATRIPRPLAFVPVQDASATKVQP